MEIEGKQCKLVTWPNVKENNYWVTRNGEVYSFSTKRWISSYPDRDGYLRISLLGKPGYNVQLRGVHQLVMNAWGFSYPPTMRDPTIDHIDGNKQNNDIDNLRWLSRESNSRARKIIKCGVDNPSAKLNPEIVRKIAFDIQNNMSLVDISKKYNVPRPTIWHIKNRDNWTDVTKDFVFPEKKSLINEPRYAEYQKFRNFILTLLNFGYERNEIQEMTGVNRERIRSTFRNYDDPRRVNPYYEPLRNHEFDPLNAKKADCFQGDYYWVNEDND